MRKIFFYIYILLSTVILNAQNFNVDRDGEQTFNFTGEIKGNQAIFYSSTPLEDVTGTATTVDGMLKFNLNDFANSLSGKLVVKVNSIKTGIALRDQHLQSSNWLDAETYPDIVFEVISVKDVKNEKDNKLKCVVTGKFTVHGITKEIETEATVIYLVESEKTKARAVGDLLGVTATFNIKLSDYEVDNAVVGTKVAEDIKIEVKLVGSNK